MLGALRMSESVAVAAGKSTGPVANRFRRITHLVPLRQAFPRLAKALWPHKPDAELAARINLSDRACRKILAERANISAEALRALLHTEDGFDGLEMLMRDPAPTCWK